MQEIWKDVNGYEGLYQVSNLGRVRSLGRINRRGVSMPARIMKPSKNPKGYLICTLTSIDGIRTAYSVHRLTISAFKDNPENLPQINHIDTDKTNNKINNLEWCDGFYNMRHAFDNGVYKNRVGEVNGMAKMTSDKVIKMRNLYATGKYNQKEISMMFGMSHSVTNSILNRKTWKHI